MKILVLSSTPWSNDNSFGNTFSNIFEGIDDIEVANISCRPGKPTSYLVKRYFQITEKSLIKNLFNKSFPTGIEIKVDNKEIDSSFSENIKAREFGSKKRWQILFWMRDLIWKLGRWKSQALIDFIDDFKPDIIFQPIYFSSYLNDMISFIKEHTGVPMVGYVSDDCYTLRQFSLSLLYWIDRLIKRRKVKRIIEQCEILYVISDIQKREYEKIFTPPCKILTKCADFSKEPIIKKKYNRPLQLVFTGNIGDNRWKTLASIAEVLEEINKNEVKAQLNIYTATPLTKKMIARLNMGESSFIRGTVPATEVQKIQSDADILVHVEGFDYKSRCLLHQSFSTKIVDYCKEARPIFAVAPSDVASMNELIRHNGAMIATSKQEIKVNLEKLVNNRVILDEYSKKSYLCGRQNYNSKNVKSMVYEDLKNIYEKGIRKKGL